MSNKASQVGGWWIFRYEGTKIALNDMETNLIPEMPSYLQWSLLGIRFYNHLQTTQKSKLIPPECEGSLLVLGGRYFRQYFRENDA